MSIHFLSNFIEACFMASIPTLATPTFVTGVNDALAVADVYNLVSPGVITDIESVLSDIESISSALLGSGLLSVLEEASALQAVATSSGSATSGLTINPTGSTSSVATASSGSTATSVASTPVDLSTLLARLGTTSSQLNTAIRGLSPNAQATITAGLNNNTSSPQQLTLNGETTTVQSSNYSDIAQVANIINAFTGQSSAAISSDTQAFAAIISGIVQICANLGLPNSFAAITAAIEDAAILAQAAQLCLPSALTTGDLQSIASMANQLTSGVVININPTIVNTYVSNFTTNFYAMIGYDTSQANGALTTIIDLLYQIDPSWNQDTRNGESLLNVSSWMGASPAFIQLVTNAAKQSEVEESTSEESSGEVLDGLSALAYLFITEFGAETVIEQLEITYPMVTLTTNEAVVMAVDPSSMLTA
jgi:hypothetical protein